MNEKEYAKELIRLMEEGVICVACPSGIVSRVESTCVKCHEFINSTYEPFLPFARCPCRRLGKSEAIKRTWLQLEEKGYLEE